jgi:DNA replication protein DnaC
MDTPRLLLEHYLKQLRLPTMVREFPKLSEQCAQEGATFEQFLLRLVEQEMLDRERRATERRIRAARFPVSKSLDTYDFLAIPSLNKKLVVELTRCEWNRQDSHRSGIRSGSLSTWASSPLYDGSLISTRTGGSSR